MKLKARNVIAGWPRGRSTSSIPWWQYKLDPMYLMLNKPREEFIREGLADLRYHRAQQEMFETFIERYRRLTEFGGCILDPGYFLWNSQRVKAYARFGTRNL